MAKSQRQKGLRRENQICARLKDLGLEALRISQPYKKGHDLDVTMPSGKILTGEVKGRKAGATPFPTLHTMMGNPPADILFLVEDQNDPLLVVRWEAFRTLFEEVATDEGKCLGRVAPRVEARAGPVPT